MFIYAYFYTVRVASALIETMSLNSKKLQFKSVPYISNVWTLY